MGYFNTRDFKRNLDLPISVTQVQELLDNSDNLVFKKEKVGLSMTISHREHRFR